MDKEEKDEYEDLKGLAFEHSEKTPRGRQERRSYREGLRRGIGGEKTFIEDSRYKEHR